MLSKVKRRLRHFADRDRAVFVQGYFKTGPGQYGHGDQFLGLNVPDLRRVAREFRSLSLDDVRALLKSKWHAERVLALLILVDQYARADASQQNVIYRMYMASTQSINNWDLVDLSAPRIVGSHLERRSRAPLYRLSKSKNIWRRRIAIMATFHFIRLGQFDDSFALAEALLDDPHDLIHKATGWMLREIGKRDQRAEESFLKRFAPKMPRTMLRYAIERFPEPLRRKYLTKSS